MVTGIILLDWYFNPNENVWPKVTSFHWLGNKLYYLWYEYSSVTSHISLKTAWEQYT